MATDVTPDARTDGLKTSGSTSLGWNHTLTAGMTNPWLAGLGTTGTGTAVDISTFQWDAAGGSPQSLVFKVRDVDFFGNCKTEIWGVSPTATGTKQVKITPPSSVEMTGGSASYQFVNQATPYNAASGQSNKATTGTTASLTVTSATHEMTITCMVENGGSALTVTGGQTVIHNENISSSNHAGASSDAPGAATVAHSYTGITSSNAWVVVGVSLQFDGGGGAAAVTTSPAFRQPVPMRTGPNGFTRGTVWAQSTSNPPVPLAPIIAIDTPRPFQMNIPMRPTAGGFVIGTPMQQARGTPVSPPAPGSRRRIRLIN